MSPSATTTAAWNSAWSSGSPVSAGVGVEVGGAGVGVEEGGSVVLGVGVGSGVGVTGSAAGQGR